MEGHLHLGLADGISFALKLIVVLAVLRVLDVLLVASEIPLLNTLGKGLAFIVH